MRLMRVKHMTRMTRMRGLTTLGAPRGAI
jgi:hypothetical protein